MITGEFSDADNNGKMKDFSRLYWIRKQHQI